MTEESIPASEEQELEIVEQEQPVQEPRTVPLEALEAERRKRQELEAQIRQIHQKEQQPEDDEDDEEFITKAELKRRLKEATFGNKREVMEEAFCAANPKAVEMINKNLEDIIKKKPWLAQVIESAPNRYARAYEIVQDYMPQDVASQRKLRDPQQEAKRIVENASKPGNPSSIAKPANMSSADYLKSIAGKPEFREYRKQLMSGR
jgi:hypothetical protein